MSSVGSVKTVGSNVTQNSKRSDARSCVSAYSKGISAYSQQHKELLTQEHQKGIEELMQKQQLEQERHRKIMMDNKKRLKMQQEQLKKDLEIRRQQEDQVLRKIKEDKRTAYIKYLKDNSNQLLQNFKKKESFFKIESTNPKRDQNDDPYNRRIYSTPSDSTPIKIHPVRGVGNAGGSMNNYLVNWNNVGLMPEIIEDEDNNLEALDLDISRSTNNFKRIIDQYHKDMDRLRRQMGDDKGLNRHKDGLKIPLQQFYDSQVQQRPVDQTSLLLQSLDLSSSLQNWDPAKLHKGQGDRKQRILNSEEKFGVCELLRYESKEEYPEKDEYRPLEEVQQHTETTNDTPHKEKLRKLSSNIISGGRNEERKLLKISEVSQRQQKQDWYMGCVDNQSQEVRREKKMNLSMQQEDSARISGPNILNIPMLKNTNPRSLDSIPNYEQTPVSPPIFQIKFGEKRNESISKQRQEGKRHFQSENSLEVVQGDDSANIPFHWADDLKEDDFYKGLAQQVLTGDNLKRPALKSNPNAIQKTYHKTVVITEAPTKIHLVEVKGPEEKGYIHDSDVKVQKKQKEEQQKKQKKEENNETKRNKTEEALQEIEKDNPIRKKAYSVSNATKKDRAEKETKEGNSGNHLKPEEDMNKSSNNEEKKAQTQKAKQKKSLSPLKRKQKKFEDLFMKLNKQESNLQQELLDIQMKEIAKVREIEQKYNITTKYKATPQIINKAERTTPVTGKAINEQDIEKSLNRLDNMLAKNWSTAPFNQGVVPLDRNFTNVMNHQSNPLISNQRDNQQPFYGGPLSYNYHLKPNKPQGVYAINARNNSPSIPESHVNMYENIHTNVYDLLKMRNPQVQYSGNSQIGAPSLHPINARYKQIMYGSIDYQHENVQMESGQKAAQKNLQQNLPLQKVPYMPVDDKKAKGRVEDSPIPKIIVNGNPVSKASKFMSNSDIVGKQQGSYLKQTGYEYERQQKLAHQNLNNESFEVVKFNNRARRTNFREPEYSGLSESPPEKLGREARNRGAKLDIEEKGNRYGMKTQQKKENYVNKTFQNIREHEKPETNEREKAKGAGYAYLKHLLLE